VSFINSLGRHYRPLVQHIEIAFSAPRVKLLKALQGLKTVSIDCSLDALRVFDFRGPTPVIRSPNSFFLKELFRIHPQITLILTYSNVVSSDTSPAYPTQYSRFPDRWQSRRSKKKPIRWLVEEITTTFDKIHEAVYHVSKSAAGPLQIRVRSENDYTLGPITTHQLLDEGEAQRLLQDKNQKFIKYMPGHV
jgi:hypothetical protein